MVGRELARIAQLWGHGPRPRRVGKGGLGGSKRPLFAVVGVIALALAIGLLAALAGAPTKNQRPTPSSGEIALVMSRTILVGEPFEHFYPAGEPATISDGNAGQLTAEVGTIVPTDDGDGQLVFFWHDNDFVGWDSAQESMSVLQLEAVGATSFRVTYANYATHDPACCPSLIPLSVVYRWDGHRFVAQSQPPAYRPIPSRVQLR